MFGLGHWEVLLVVLAVLVLFGKRIPGLARSMGRSIVNFRHGLNGRDGGGGPNQQER